MISKKDIAGSVVLYNSPIEVLDNISTYIDQISKLYVVDNSVTPNAELIKELQKNSKIKYISLQGNKGIATALNFAAQEALADNYSVLLTMDDDTQTPSSMIDEMITFWNQFPHPIGILSGSHHSKLKHVPYRRLLYTLTSGNLLNLDAYTSVGNFKDDLFIDHVDHEYGLRLNEKGYQVIEIPSIRLVHRLGYIQQIKLGSRTIAEFGSHSPIRLYYYTRNGLHLSRIYLKQSPAFVLNFVENLSKLFIKAILLQKDRKHRIKMLTKGLIDGWNGNLGKINS
ncbi:glycosyltransferase [Spirosoma sp. BT702]|uniref:Glycosyltransferase n=1 Tax=Spirosoma profusum TaxID=2771354 RepID=A0A926Y4T8_9BACT|nr:glycosyltransferase [Spirosoma profusum]MBD2703596.1 glycosyltransferase [Spirosoma profusum]